MDERDERAWVAFAAASIAGREWEAAPAEQACETADRLLAELRKRRASAEPEAGAGRVIRDVSAMLEQIAAAALAAGHRSCDLAWARPGGSSERWDLVHADGRWLGGVEIVRDGSAIYVRPTEEPPR